MISNYSQVYIHFLMTLVKNMLYVMRPVLIVDLKFWMPSQMHRNMFSTVHHYIKRRPKCVAKLLMSEDQEDSTHLYHPVPINGEQKVSDNNHKMNSFNSFIAFNYVCKKSYRTGWNYPRRLFLSRRQRYSAYHTIYCWPWNWLPNCSRYQRQQIAINLLFELSHCFGILVIIIIEKIIIV